MELYEDVAGSGKREAYDAREADHDDTLVVDVLHEQVTFFGKKNTSVCVADGESAEMDATGIVGPVVQSLQYCDEDMRGDNILEAVRYLYQCQCNQCIAEPFGEDTPVDGLFLCTLSDDLSSPASCNFDFVDSHLHLAVSQSCDTDVMKQKTFADVVRGGSNASELDEAVAPAVWKFSLGACEVTTQEIVDVSDDTGEESSDSEEIKLDQIESRMPMVNRVSASGAAELSGRSDDGTVPFGTACGSLSRDTSGLLVHSSTGGSDDSLMEFDKTSKPVDIGYVRDADQSFTEPRLLVDTYENRSGVVMVSEQLQTCGVAAKVSVSVQCSPEQASFGCQVDLYDSDTSDDVTSSSSYDDESGIDGDTECDVGEECASFTRGGENANRTHVEREICGPLSVVVHNIEADTNTSGDDEKETSLGADCDSHRGVVCDSSSSMESDEDGHETSESDDNDDVFKAEPSESESDEGNSGVD